MNGRQTDRYVVIDGYNRIAALEQLGRGTVEAVVWPMSEVAAVLLDRSDHHTNGPAVGPDGSVYFTVGTATNAVAVVATR
jgi:hypothetical protein